MRFIYLTAMVLLGCQGERVVVLEEPPDPPPSTPIETCEAALTEGEPGDDCVGLEMGCSESVGCCVEAAFCELGSLILVEDCSGCEVCVEDADCGPLAWCVGEGDCVPCPMVDGCPPCPDDLIPVDINGCETCECVPPISDCSIDEDCGDPASLYCAQGALCTRDHPSCCVNVCTEFDCAAVEPPPEGCMLPCLDELMCESGLCEQLGCRCVEDHWECDEVCATESTIECWAEEP